jgi:K+-sensing histidine kinase KdpD
VFQVKYELQIVSLQAEKDKHEIESERARLRSLIGNVAHDLKTPLQSIGETSLRVIEVE